MSGLKVTRISPYGAVLPYALSMDATYTGDDADWPSSPTGSGPDVSLVTVAASGSTETIDVSAARVYDVTLTADCTFTFSGAVDDEAWMFVLILRQDGTGGWTSTWPGSVEWPGGVAPTLDETASTVEILTFITVDGGTVWFGFDAGSGGGTGGPDVDLVTVAATGATETVDVSVARTYDLTLDADCTLTLTGATTAEAWYLTLFLRQDGTGGWEVTWPASVEWAAGVAPTLSTTPGDVDVITLVTLDGGTVWFGFPAGGGSSSVAALDDLTDVTITTPATDQVLTYSGGAWINAAIPTSHWEVLMTGSGASLEAVTNDAETDWLYAEV